MWIISLGNNRQGATPPCLCPPDRARTNAKLPLSVCIEERTGLRLNQMGVERRLSLFVSLFCRVSGVITGRCRQFRLGHLHVVGFVISRRLRSGSSCPEVCLSAGFSSLSLVHRAVCSRQGSRRRPTITTELERSGVSSDRHDSREWRSSSDYLPHDRAEHRSRRRIATPAGGTSADPAA